MLPPLKSSGKPSCKGWPFWWPTLITFRVVHKDWDLGNGRPPKSHQFPDNKTHLFTNSG